MSPALFTVETSAIRVTNQATAQCGGGGANLPVSYKWKVH